MKRILLYVAIIAANLPAFARAEEAKTAEGTIGYSGHGGLYARLWGVIPADFKLGHIIVGAEVSGDLIGVAPGTAVTDSFREGVAPSNLWGGFALQWNKNVNKYFEVWLQAAVFVGVANTQYGVTYGGSALADIKYLRLDGTFQGFVNDRFSTVYDFAARIRPYITWLDLIPLSCDSRDGWVPDGSDKASNPCGTGAGLTFALGDSTPVSIAPSAIIDWFDLHGNRAHGKDDISFHAQVTVKITY